MAVRELFGQFREECDDVLVPGGKIAGVVGCAPGLESFEEGGAYDDVGFALVAGRAKSRIGFAYGSVWLGKHRGVPVAHIGVQFLVRYECLEIVVGRCQWFDAFGVAPFFPGAPPAVVLAETLRLYPSGLPGGLGNFGWSGGMVTHLRPRLRGHHRHRGRNRRSRFLLRGELWRFFPR